MSNSNMYSPENFAQRLYEKMARLSPAVENLDLYEFRYGLDNLYPQNGWACVELEPRQEIERLINTLEFYAGIQLKPRVGEAIVLDSQVVRLTNMLFVGLVARQYTEEWIKTHFYFDVRGFFFLVRTVYFDAAVRQHLGNRPYRRFAPRQKQFERYQGIGYKNFQKANAEVDCLFINCIHRLIAAQGTPILLAIAGPTAAGKTEIVARLRSLFESKNRPVASIEMDNFLTDRDPRENKGIDSLGREAIHLSLFQQALEDISNGRDITIPCYDFINGTSSHDLNGILKPGRTPLEIEAADIIFVEGNFPFLLPEVAHLIGVKVVYLTDDPVRLKRKWKRDIDYRKKYEPTYFRNRFFKDQFMMAQKCYRPQMERCDMVVDTTGAALWTTPEMAKILEGLH